MNLASVASQLRAAHEAPGAAQAAAQAGAAAASVGGALQAGSERARGMFKGLAGRAQSTLHLGSQTPTPAADGTSCEGCSEPFGMFRRRHSCSSCDRFLCPACIGGTHAFGISCMCSAVCPRCRSQNAQHSEFQACRAAMESGVGVMITFPSKAKTGFFGGGSAGRGAKLDAWLSLSVDRETGELHWASLRQQGGRPAEEGRILVYEIINVRNTGLTLELALKDQAQATILEFGQSGDLETWAKYIELAVVALTPDSERAALDAARASHRQLEMEERRARNEERKKQLSDGLGMRFTAEAMMRRG